MKTVARVVSSETTPQLGAFFLSLGFEIKLAVYS